MRENNLYHVLARSKPSVPHHPPHLSEQSPWPAVCGTGAWEVFGGSPSQTISFANVSYSFPGSK